MLLRAEVKADLRELVGVAQQLREGVLDVRQQRQQPRVASRVAHQRQQPHAAGAPHLSRQVPSDLKRQAGSPMARASMWRNEGQRARRTCT